MTSRLLLSNVHCLRPCHYYRKISNSCIVENKKGCPTNPAEQEAWTSRPKKTSHVRIWGCGVVHWLARLPAVRKVPGRVSSKWKKKNFGSNRNKPKQDLFRVCFGLFRETKKKIFRFVSVFRTFIETTETNRTVSKRTETIRNVLKNLSYIYLGSSFIFL
jgi:hypothetical protein